MSACGSRENFARLFFFISSILLRRIPGTCWRSGVGGDVFYPHHLSFLSSLVSSCVEEWSKEERKKKDFFWSSMVGPFFLFCICCCPFKRKKNPYPTQSRTGFFFFFILYLKRRTRESTLTWKMSPWLFIDRYFVGKEFSAFLSLPLLIATFFSLLSFFFIEGEVLVNGLCFIQRRKLRFLSWRALCRRKFFLSSASHSSLLWVIVGAHFLQQQRLVVFQFILTFTVGGGKASFSFFSERV